jgi:dienelactone hydrolase
MARYVKKDGGTTMYKKYLIIIMLLFGFIVQISFADSVKFKSNSKGKDEMPLMLTGILTEPEGDGPFPAVALLHGCSGLQGSKSRSELWSNRLVNWGYVTLQIDSFGPRNVSSICADYSQILGMSFARAQDAYDAKDFLSKLPFVDRNRISLLGWSHGGMTVLTALIKKIKPQNRQIPFNSAIAFYPYCDTSLINLNAPLLILIGEIDDWTPPKLCSAMMPPEQSSPEVILKIYHGAYHDFDWEGMDEIYEGHRLLYDPIAAADAIDQVKYFLAKHHK